jgi:hypothetical protein
MIQVEGETSLSAVHKLINYIWNKDKSLSMEGIYIVPIHKKDDKSDCNNYRGVSLLNSSVV